MTARGARRAVGALALADAAVARAASRLAAAHDAAHQAGEWHAVDRLADALLRLGVVLRDLRSIRGSVA